MPVSATAKCSTTSASSCSSMPTLTARPTSPLVGELDRVAEQVDEDLAQPPGDRRRRRSGTSGDDVADELEPLLVRAQRQRRASSSVDHLAQIEVDAQSSRQLARLDLREVEDVVDAASAANRAEACDHRRGIRAARACSSVSSDQLGHADARRSSASGSRGSCWRGTRSWRGWPPRRRPWPSAGPPSAWTRGAAAGRPNPGWRP